MDGKVPEAAATKAYFEAVAARYAERSASAVWHWQRRRELAAVLALLGDVGGLDVLDLGCGAGYYTRHCLDRGAREVTAVDFSPRMIAQLPKDRVRGIVADAAAVTLDRRFAKIVCAGLLEFTADPGAVLGNARRLVRADGTMACLAPPDNVAGRLYRGFHRRNGIDIALFSRSAFTGLAMRAGWRMDSCRPVFPHAFACRLTAE